VKLYDIVKVDAEVKVLDIGCKQVAGDPSNYTKLRRHAAVGIDLPGNGADTDFQGTVISAALGDGNEHDLYVCKLETCSSLYKPNLELMKKYNNIAEWLEVVDVQRMQTTKLNDIDLPFSPDYIKSDIQASDLMAITYGEKWISTALAIEIEVEFVEQYLDQPLFSDVEIELRKLGFQFYTFTGYGSRLLKPHSDPADPFAPSDQWLWAHAVFITKRKSEATDLEILKLATIAHDVYGAKDLAAHYLEELDLRSGSALCKKYLEYQG